MIRGPKATLISQTRDVHEGPRGSRTQARPPEASGIRWPHPAEPHSGRPRSFRRGKEFWLLLGLWAASVPPGRASASALGADASSPLTLEEAVARALVHNLGQRRSRLSLEIRRSEAKRAEARRRRPRVEADVSASVARAPLTVFETTGSRHVLDQESRTTQAEIRITQQLPLNGSLAIRATGSEQVRDLDDSLLPREVDGALEANLGFPLLDRSGSFADAETRVRWAEEDAALAHRAASADLEVRVVGAFYELVRALGQAEIREQAHAESRAQAALARQKLTAGLIPEGDALQLEVTRDLAEAAAIDVMASVQRARDELATLLGAPLTPGLHIHDEVPDAPHATVDEARAMDLALANRIELHRAEIAVSQARLTQAEAQSAGGINGRLNASVGLRGTGASAASARDQRVRDGALGVSFHLPLWDAGIQRRIVNEAAATVAQIELDREATVRAITLDLRQRFRGLQRARGRARVLATAESAARRAWEIAQRRFEAGNIDSQRLVQEQNSFRQSESAHLDAIIDVHLALATLRRAILSPVPYLSDAAESPDARR